MFDKGFVEQYTKYGPGSYVDFDGITSANQTKKDVTSLYGALQSFCKKGSVKSILLKYNTTRNELAVWEDVIDTFGNDGDQEARISKLEVVLNTHFSKQYKVGLTQWVQDYQNVFAELEIFGVMAYIDEESKKRKITQNCVAPESRDAIYERDIQGQILQAYL